VNFLSPNHTKYFFRTKIGRYSSPLWITSRELSLNLWRIAFPYQPTLIHSILFVVQKEKTSWNVGTLYLETWLDHFYVHCQRTMSAFAWDSLRYVVDSSYFRIRHASLLMCYLSMHEFGSYTMTSWLSRWLGFNALTWDYLWLIDEVHRSKDLLLLALTSGLVDFDNDRKKRHELTDSGQKHTIWTHCLVWVRLLKKFDS